MVIKCPPSRAGGGAKCLGYAVGGSLSFDLTGTLLHAIAPENKSAIEPESLMILPATLSDTQPLFVLLLFLSLISLILYYFGSRNYIVDFLSTEMIFTHMYMYPSKCAKASGCSEMFTTEK